MCSMPCSRVGVRHMRHMCCGAGCPHTVHCRVSGNHANCAAHSLNNLGCARAPHPLQDSGSSCATNHTCVNNHQHHRHANLYQALLTVQVNGKRVSEHTDTVWPAAQLLDSRIVLGGMGTLQMGQGKRCVAAGTRAAAVSTMPTTAGCTACGVLGSAWAARQNATISAAACASVAVNAAQSVTLDSAAPHHADNARATPMEGTRVVNAPSK